MNLKLIVRDREKLPLKDKDFNEYLELLTGWPTNLYRLYEIDPNEIIVLHFPTEQFIQATKNLGLGSDDFLNTFCETMDRLLESEFERKHIDIDKLHYGMDEENGIEYEYCHINKNDYEELLNKHKDRWYKIICVVPMKTIHRDIFFVPQSRLHEFFNKDIYKCYDGEKRTIIHVEPITKEERGQEIKKVKETIKRHEKEKFRTNEYIAKEE